jgi:hypothetical protein
MMTTSSVDSYVEGDDFDDRDFRRSVWRQTLTSVALVTVSTGERDNVMACEWATMVSHAPMCFTISVHPRHATHDLLIEAGEFGLSFCSDAQAHLSHVSGSNSLHDVRSSSTAESTSESVPRYRSHSCPARSRAGPNSTSAHPTPAPATDEEAFRAGERHPPVEPDTARWGGRERRPHPGSQPTTDTCARRS